ncbi:L-arabinose ABC transporter ATP-binding protein AraG [Rhodobacter sp. KR11]|uniref:L-arabinose ABC transporter ATP-binding protein AraG n=1 Tax=Rhodobacter sp. KR11 TaxID=2974588 RepID=UPI00222325DE|nr:L-arabinose ABC transporter ATP-binding protein AraG [Rhodobacter sp. KR11]MCW1919516.1 L-arabinose ABC transporter ATP-binding protein AraG [Rhodobacter sp. KR11]
MFLEFDGLTKTYPGVTALSGVSFGVAKGAVHGLMGENGAGKSTLIKILSGDVAANAGGLRIDGTQQTYATTRDAFDAGVIVIHQELQLVPELSVAENLTLGRFPAQAGVIARRRMQEMVAARLQAAGIDIDPRAKVATLSIGERQMVEIAKAVMLDARVIALDEPTSSLSSRESEVLFALIGRLRAEGKVILYVSHRMDEIFRLCDGLTVLRDGKLAAHHATLDGVTRDQVVSEMVGRKISDIWGYRPRTPGAVRLQAQGITSPALPEPASFQVRAGEILGFFGLIGAGRSELMRALFGADPRRGSLRIDGAEITAQTPRAMIRAGLVLCSEDRKHDGILQGRSIEENIAISSRRHTSRFGILNRRAEADTADTYISRLRIRTPSRAQDILNLSGGNQQKVILARWLSEQGVKVMIVDEPTRGIDVGAKAEIYDLLFGLAEQGLAVIVVSSDLPEVMGICDRIHVMCQGRIRTDLHRADFTEHAILSAALPDRS